MKSKFSTLFFAAAILRFSACDKGGGDKQAAPAGIQGGRIQGMTNQNDYCDIGTNSITCGTTSTYGMQCQPTVIPFTDMTTLCQNARQAMYSVCGASALQNLVAQRCPVEQNNPQLPNPQFPNFPNLDDVSNIREGEAAFQCEFEAQRINHGRFLWMPTTSGVSTGLQKHTIRLSIRDNFEYDLRSKFIFDAGRLGRTTLKFSRANLKGSADTITLVNSGLNKEIVMSQSGFAGQTVSLEAENDSGSLKYRVSCKGFGNFKRIASVKPVSKYECKGISSLGIGTEDIDLSVPYNTDLAGSEIELASKLTLNVHDNTVKLTALDVAGNVTVQSSAHLKEKIQLKLRDYGSDVDVTCSPK